MANQNLLHPSTYAIGDLQHQIYRILTGESNPGSADRLWATEALAYLAGLATDLRLIKGMLSN
jgi:hypothetical protein